LAVVYKLHRMASDACDLINLYIVDMKANNLNKPFLEAAIDSFAAIFEPENADPALEMASATPAQDVDITTHLIAQPSREDLICILKRHYPNYKGNLEESSDNDLFYAYKKGIENGRIPYDKSKGYTGGECPTSSSSSSVQPQNNVNSSPSRRAQSLNKEIVGSLRQMKKDWPK